jgi:hypothetical protein
MACRLRPMEQRAPPLPRPSFPPPRPPQLPTLRQIIREEGVQALWQGIKPRVLFHIPAAAVCWGTYESMKNSLRGQ